MTAFIAIGKLVSIFNLIMILSRWLVRVHCVIHNQSWGTSNGENFICAVSIYTLVYV